MLASTPSYSVGRSDTGSAGSGCATAAGVTGVCGFGIWTGPSLFCRDALSTVLVGGASGARRFRVRALIVAAGGESRSTFVVASFEASCGRSNMASTVEGSDFGVRASSGSAAGSPLAGLVSVFRRATGRALGVASVGAVASPSVLVLFLNRSEVARAEKGRTMAANIVNADVGLSTEGEGEGEGERARGFIGAGPRTRHSPTHSPGPRSGDGGGGGGGWSTHFGLGLARDGPLRRVLSRLVSQNPALSIPVCHCFHSFRGPFSFENSE